MIERLWKTYDIDLHWAPFFLDPSMPPEGRTRAPQTTADSPKSNLELRGEEVGIEFRRGRTFSPNTHLAQQAAHFCHDHGTAQQVLDYHRALFKAFFTDFENLMDIDVLVKHAVAAGLDGEALRAALQRGDYREAVDQGVEHSYAIGVTGIPTFILNDRYAVVGAQEYAVFERVMAELGVPRRNGAPPSSDGALEDFA